MKNINQDIQSRRNGLDSEQNSREPVQTGKFALPACPHCGKRMNPFTAWAYKTKGEYRCNKCGQDSDVFSDGWTPAFGVIAVAISVLMLILFLFVFGGMSFLGIFFMVLPFLFFSFCAPFLVRLKKMPTANPAPQAERRPEPRRSPPPPPRPRTQASRPGTTGYGQRPPQSRPTQTRPPQQRPPASRPGTRPAPTQQRGPAAGARPPVRQNPNPRPPSPRPPQQQRPNVAPRRSPVDNLGQTRVINPNPNPKLFDTMEFGKRAPKDFSDYKDQ